jgi:uncharacterized protein (TIGR02996 family)
VALDPTEVGLLRAVLAAPADDRPRLVYADWLSQRGDPWGELIVLQIGGQGPARQSELLRELAAAAPDWAASWPPPLARGFATSLTVRPELIVERSQEIVVRHPLAEVHTPDGATRIRVSRDRDRIALSAASQAKRDGSTGQLVTQVVTVHDVATQRLVFRDETSYFEDMGVVERGEILVEVNFSEDGSRLILAKTHSGRVEHPLPK